jgi:protein-S-isoprenylcysteine O-methyltransferase Ste14
MRARAHNISPHVYLLATFVTALTTLLIYQRVGFEQQWFLTPLLGLAFLYASINFYRQINGASGFTRLKHIHWRQLIKQALARYLVWLVIISSGNWLYQTLPFYSSEKFHANFMFFDQLLLAYLIIGVPYFVITLILKSSQQEDFYDPAIRLLHIGKQLTLGLFKEEKNKTAERVLRNPYNRKVLLNLAMRAYFIPIMVIQVLGNTLSNLEMINRISNDNHILNFLYFTATFLWLMDIINATLGYCLESRWLENRSRSIDMTVTGWVVCFCCYEPLNQVTGSFFPFAPFVATHDPQALIVADVNVLIGFKMLEILFLCGHIYSDVSLGPSIVNITLKKLQTRGPYGLVRHPGTTTKLLYWLSQSIAYKQFWTLKIVYGYAMWAAIYVGRALTEERQLKKYPEYREYMKKVKYRFFPWLF